MFGWFRRKSVAPNASILEREYNTCIAGVERVPDGIELVRKLRVGDQVYLVREPDNPHDRNAIAVLNTAKQKLGYIPARIAADLARALEEDSGTLSNATVMEKTASGRDHKRYNASLRFHLARVRRDRSR
jgi:single-stranded-DNA-specific exonuclease